MLNFNLIIIFFESGSILHLVIDPIVEMDYMQVDFEGKYIALHFI